MDTKKYVDGRIINLGFTIKIYIYEYPAIKYKN